MDVKELKDKIGEIRALIETAPAGDPMGKALGLIGLGIVGELLIDIKRIADANEQLATIAVETEGRRKENEASEKAHFITQLARDV